MPDLSILPNLSKVFETDILAILNGEMEERDMNNGNMKNINFYVYRRIMPGNEGFKNVGQAG